MRRITVELPDDLLVSAKKRAAELRIPLRQLVEEGLRHVLKDLQSGKRHPRKKIRWVTVKGGLPPGLDLSSRPAMMEYIQRKI
ncbi:MAG: hypothetical protein ABSG31_11415 [Tepidisphaeraceae bacterium]